MRLPQPATRGTGEPAAVTGMDAAEGWYPGIFSFAVASAVRGGVSPADTALGIACGLAAAAMLGVSAVTLLLPTSCVSHPPGQVFR